MAERVGFNRLPGTEVGLQSAELRLTNGLGRDGKSLSTVSVTDASRGLKRTFDAMNENGLGMEWGCQRIFSGCTDGGPSRFEPTSMN